MGQGVGGSNPGDANFFFLLFRNQGIAENEGNEVRSLKVEMEKPHI